MLGLLIGVAVPNVTFLQVFANMGEMVVQVALHQFPSDHLVAVNAGSFLFGMLL